jgi:hypothetical protein
MIPALRPLKQDVVGSTGNLLWVLVGTIGFVLLIACANVVNLMQSIYYASPCARSSREACA